MAVTTSPKTPAERVPVQFWFDYVLPDDDAISTASTVVEAVVVGTDPNADTILDGATAISGQKAVQWIVGGVAGVSYRLRCTIISTQGRKFEARAVLPVRALV
jgi:hypothetical protein